MIFDLNGVIVLLLIYKKIKYIYRKLIFRLLRSKRIISHMAKTVFESKYQNTLLK